MYVQAVSGEKEESNKEKLNDDKSEDENNEDIVTHLSDITLSLSNYKHRNYIKDLLVFDAIS